jgi:F-type H+-transporting ATPase subunit alpha
MPADNALIEKLRKQIETLPQSPEVRKIGTVLQVADGVARVSGLSEVLMGEQVYFPKARTYGLALNLGKEAVGVVILGNWEAIEASETVESTGKILQVPVGEALIGRVVIP